MIDTVSPTVVSIDTVRREKQIADAALSAAPVPDFIKARSIADMTDEEQDHWLMGIRARRLEAIRRVEAVKQQKAELSSLSSRHKLEKKLEQVRRQEEKLNVTLEKLEELVFQARALALQL